MRNFLEFCKKKCLMLRNLFLRLRLKPKSTRDSKRLQQTGNTFVQQKNIKELKNMSDDVKNSLSKFFSSSNFIDQSEVIQTEIVALVSDFTKKGFEVWPVWRDTHSSNQNKVWTLKTENKRNSNGFDNVVTVYQMKESLKVEVYCGHNGKKPFYFSSSGDNSELFKVASDNYQNNLDKKLSAK